jgi:hypothetical protein
MINTTAMTYVDNRGSLQCGFIAIVNLHCSSRVGQGNEDRHEQPKMMDRLRVEMYTKF